MTCSVRSEHNTCWFLFYKQEHILLTKQHRFPDHFDVLGLQSSFIRQFSLGQYHGIDYFCAEIQADIDFSNAFYTISLKQALGMIYPQKYLMGVKAYSIMRWDNNHQFCGRCATPTLQNTPQFERICPTCHLSFFPRISPSIIVLIHREQQLIMARSSHFAPGIYGLIAGFIEVGESAEDAVHREIQEEVGLQVKNISYFGSQSWPFPDALMLGFIAEYDSGELIIDHNELEDAGWYHYNNLPGRPSSPFSIASQLLDHFIQQCQNTE